MAYVIGIDQSTQGTKVLLFDGNGNIMYRADRPHRQIINDRGWVSHDMEEVYANLINGVRELLEQTGVDDKKDCRCRYQQPAGDHGGLGKRWKTPGSGGGVAVRPGKGHSGGAGEEGSGTGGEGPSDYRTALSPYFPRQRWHGCFARRERPFIWERWTAILSTV